MLADRLALVVEEVYGGTGHEEKYTRAYFNWVHLLHMLDTQQDKFDRAKLDKLNSTLSQTQWLSIQLLHEWWDGLIQDKELSEAATSGILTAAMAPLITPLDLEKAPAVIRDHLHLETLNDSTLPWSPNLEESLYHQEMYNLWRCEFCIVDPGKYDLALDPLRRQAAITAANQRIAWSCFKEVLKGATEIKYSTGQRRQNLTSPLRAAAITYSGLKTKKDGVPYFLWSCKEQRTVRADLLPERPRYIVVSHTWGRWRLRGSESTTIEGVPWPVPKNSRFEVEKLPHILKEATCTTPYVWIDLFCIPQVQETHPLYRIMSEELARQGEIFSNADGATIWFNDVENWVGLESTVLWYAATWLKNSKSKSRDEFTVLDSWIQELYKSASQPTHLFESYTYSGSGSLAAATPSGWFSSLWTLQEACLRPDMLLVDRNWRVFSVGPNNLIVTLETLVALVQEMEVQKFKYRTVTITEAEFQRLPIGKSVLDPQASAVLCDLLPIISPLPEAGDWELPDMPRGAAELRTIVNKYEMQQILDIKSTTVLSLANQRYCEHSRAQAIMSVVGATKWYTDQLKQFGSQPAEEGLVLGRYPLQFVNEVRKQLGSQFFNSHGAGSGCAREIFERDEENEIIRIKPVGSMMPFASSEKVSKRAVPFEKSSEDHPSVVTWTLFADGTCGITQACVITSFKPNMTTVDSEARRPLRALIEVHDCNKPSRPREVDLHKFLGEYSPQFNIYAVVLCHGLTSRECSGILLQEVVSPGGDILPFIHKTTESLARYQPPTKLLLRVGWWSLWDLAAAPELPNSREVEWLVL